MVFDGTMKERWALSLSSRSAYQEIWVDYRLSSRLDITADDALQILGIIGSNIKPAAKSVVYPGVSLLIESPQPDLSRSLDRKLVVGSQSGRAAPVCITASAEHHAQPICRLKTQLHTPCLPRQHPQTSAAQPQVPAALPQPPFLQACPSSSTHATLWTLQAPLPTAQLPLQAPCTPDHTLTPPLLCSPFASHPPLSQMPAMPLPSVPLLQPQPPRAPLCSHTCGPHPLFQAVLAPHQATCSLRGKQSQAGLAQHHLRRQMPALSVLADSRLP